jgi:hypothetical protein
MTLKTCNKNTLPNLGRYAFPHPSNALQFLLSRIQPNLHFLEVILTRCLSINKQILTEMAIRD